MIPPPSWASWKLAIDSSPAFTRAVDHGGTTTAWHHDGLALWCRRDSQVVG